MVADELISMEHWWNDTNKERPKYWEENSSQCHFIQHVYH